MLRSVPGFLFTLHNCRKELHDSRILKNTGPAVISGKCNGCLFYLCIFRALIVSPLNGSNPTAG